MKLTEFTKGLIQDVYALREDYIPEQVLFREEMITKINRAVFVPPLRGRPGSHMMIQGTTGTGKTLSVNYCNEWSDNEARENNIDTKYIKKIYINCRTHPSQNAVSMEIAKQLMPQGDWKKGYAVHEYLEKILDYIDENFHFVTIILDEVDNIIPHRVDTKEGDVLFYTMVRAREIRRLNRAYISLVCIANNPQVMDRLSEGTRSSFGINILHFPRYTYQQLYQILSNRASKAFSEGSVQPGLIENIARYGSDALSGDCRKSISLLKISAEVADIANARTINETHFQEAKEINEKNILKTELNDMGLHERIIFYAIGFFIEKEKRNPKVTEVFNYYNRLCATLKREPLKERMIRIHLKSLSKAELVDEFMDCGKIFYKPLVEKSIILEALKEFTLIYTKKAERAEMI